MDIADLLSPDGVVLRGGVSSKRQALGAVADLAANAFDLDVLFGLFAPPSAGAEHLRALAVVSRAMRSPELRERLRQAQTVDGVQALFVQTGSAAAA